MVTQRQQGKHKHYLKINVNRPVSKRKTLYQNYITRKTNVDIVVPYKQSLKVSEDY